MKYNNMKFDLIETPIFDDYVLGNAFMEWHKKCSEEKIILEEKMAANEKIVAGDNSSEDILKLYKEYYHKIGVASNELFNDLTEVHFGN